MDKLTVTKELAEKLDLLIAGLLDDKESRLAEMGEERLDPTRIPAGSYREILSAFFEAEDKGIAPTAENIALLLPAKEAEMIRKIAPRKSAAIKALVIWVNANLTAQELSLTVKSINEIDKLPYLDLALKREAMLDALSQTSVNARRTTYSELQAFSALHELQAKRVYRAQTGKKMGAILHVEKLRELIPVLVDGDVTLITAPPKSGKTTSVMYLAEENAYRNDIDVLVLLTETAPVDIANRLATRDTLIPMRYWRNGQVDLEKQPFKKMWDQLQEQAHERWNTLGRIYYEYSPGMSIGLIEAHISTWKRVAHKRGRPLVVILDYLQRIKRPSNQNDVQMLAMVSNQLKDIAAGLDVHLILFAQETFSKENKLDGDSKAHGSNVPLMIAQNHIAIRRKPALSTIMLNEGENDFFGRPRYYQQKKEGQMAATVKFEVLRSNNDETGAGFVIFENPLFRMIDLSMWSEEDFIRKDAIGWLHEINNWESNAIPSAAHVQRPSWEPKRG